MATGRKKVLPGCAWLILSKTGPVLCTSPYVNIRRVVERNLKYAKPLAHCASVHGEKIQDREPQATADAFAEH